MSKGKYTRTAEIRQKTRVSLTGKKRGSMSEAQKEKIRKTLQDKEYKPVAEATKEKISKTLTGRKQSAETVEKRRKALVGIQRSPETIEKYRVAATTPERIEASRVVGKANVGDKNGNWNGGTSFEEYPREFNEAKRQVRERDNHTCQCCSRTRAEEGQELSVHHIDYDKCNCADDNLITLCRRCNSKANGSAINRYVYMRVFQQKLADLRGYCYGALC